MERRAGRVGNRGGREGVVGGGERACVGLEGVGG